VFSLRDVEKVYDAGGTKFRLSVPRLDIARGSKLAMIGESGSGKSTLLELLAMILRPSRSGMFRFRPVASGSGHNVEQAWQSRAADALSDWRSLYIGYVLQHGGLLPYLTVRRNIELPRRLLGMPTQNVAEKLAAKLGIAAQLDKLPVTLSVGQRQRTAIAHLVALADELDVTLILATHAQELVRRAGFSLIAHQVDASDDQFMTVTVSNA
jgi:putative ABC transport system ATP-binding protein